MGSRLANLHADGGATRNKTLMQFQADILGRTVLRSRNEELSAIGAARLAGLTLGWWRGLAEMECLAKCEDSFSPSISDGEREALGRGWKDAVRRTRLAAEAN